MQPMINIVHERCQRWRYKKSSCRVCVDACPVKGCMALEGSRVEIKRERCTGCGICTSACPTGAIKVDGLSDRDLLERLRQDAEGRSLVLFCGLGPERDGVPYALPKGPLYAKLPCLALLGEAHLVALILSGVKDLHLDCGLCAECRFHTGKKAIEKSAGYAGNLLSGMGFRKSIMIDNGPHVTVGRGLSHLKKIRDVKEIECGPLYSRREFFTFFKEKASERLIGQACGKEAAFVKDPEIPERRSILIEALKDSGLRPPIVKHGSFPSYQLRVGDNCAMCFRCESFCPTGAIKRVEMGGSATVTFSLGRCMGCHQCAEFCPEGALSYEEEVEMSRMTSGEPEILMSKELIDCPQCGVTFLFKAGQASCPSCRKRETLDKNIISILFTGKNSKKALHKEMEKGEAAV